MSAANCSFPSSISAGCWCVRASPGRSGGRRTAIGDLLQRRWRGRARPQVRGFTKRSGGKGWSDEIIDRPHSGLPMRTSPCRPTGSSTRT